MIFISEKNFIFSQTPNLAVRELDNNEIMAAITALLSVGVLLLNTGANLIQLNLVNGVVLIAVGVILILIAVYLFKTLAANVAAKVLKPVG